MRRIIREVTDAMIAKAALPYWKSTIQRFPDSPRGTTLNELHSALKRHIRPRRERYVEVIGHQHRSFHLISSLIPIMQ